MKKLTKEEQATCNHLWHEHGNRDNMQGGKIGFDAHCIRCGKRTKLIYEYIGTYEEAYGREW